MKFITKAGMALCFAAALGYAANLNGTLLDSTCAGKDSQATQTSNKKIREKLSQSCAATASTTNFAVMTSDGSIYKLDSSGNSKAESALKSGSLKPDKDGDVHVSVMGTAQGDTVSVDTISSGKSHER